MVLNSQVIPEAYKILLMTSANHKNQDTKAKMGYSIQCKWSVCGEPLNITQLAKLSYLITALLTLNCLAGVLTVHRDPSSFLDHRTILTYSVKIGTQETQEKET